MCNESNVQSFWKAMLSEFFKNQFSITNYFLFTEIRLVWWQETQQMISKNLDKINNKLYLC